MNIRGRMSGAHPLLKISAWLGIMLSLTIIVMVIYSLLIRTNILSASSISTLKWLQLAQSLAVFVIPAWLATNLWSSQPTVWLHLRNHIGWGMVGLIGLTMLIAIPGINWISDINSHMQLPACMANIESAMRAMEEQAQNLMEQFLHTSNIGGLFINLVLLAIVPALGEEMTFRGVCMGMMGEGNLQEQPNRRHLSKKTHWAIWVTAAVFSFIHFQFYGFVPRMLLGALLGYLLCWTGSLWAPILAHSVNNAIAVIAYYIGEHTTIDADAIENIGIGEMWWLGLTSLLVTLGMLWIVREKATKQ